MSRGAEADLCVIGAGSGGLSVAAGAAQMGARVTLIEKAEMGGDCLNVGCVPSKALLAAAKRAHLAAGAEAFGLSATPPAVDYAAVMRHVREVIDAIAPHDSQERFEGLGVRVIRAEARFVGPREVEAGGERIRAKYFVIATGSRPAIPPIPGLDKAPYLTHETLWRETTPPERLVIIGGGPIGLEMAQAHRRLGSEVTVIEQGAPLAKDDRELAHVALKALRAEGVVIRSGFRAESVSASQGLIRVATKNGSPVGAVVEGDRLLVAAGRRPALDGLGLEAAEVEHSPRGVTVDARLRTSNKRIFAIGDVAIGPGAGLQFTHVAGYHAGIVIRNALFRLPARASLAHIPWTTYTDPELAQVGLTVAQARERHGDKVQTLEWSFKDNDRAQAERRLDGRLRAAVDRSGRIFGCGIVGPQAGELIQPWALALAKGLRVRDLTGMVAPYPTFGEVTKRAAGQFYAPKLFSDRTRWVVRQLLKLPF